MGIFLLGVVSGKNQLTRQIALPLESFLLHTSTCHTVPTVHCMSCRVLPSLTPDFFRLCSLLYRLYSYAPEEKESGYRLPSSRKSVEESL